MKAVSNARLDQENTATTWGFLYNDLDFKRSYWVKISWVLFFVRRLAVATLMQGPITFSFITVTSFGYIIFLVVSKPYKEDIL
jgi:hypothetical protein